MNIFAPIEATPVSGLPVLVFMPGGGYTVNSAASPLFDGRYLAAMTSSVVVVTNYRLGKWNTEKVSVVVIGIV